MLNLVRMNMYRMVHMKSARILLLILIGMAALTVYLHHLDLDQEYVVQEAKQKEYDSATLGFSLTVEGEQADEEDMEASSDGKFGIYSEEPEGTDGKMAPFIAYFYADLASGLLLIFLTIMVVMFVNSENSTGFIKNIAGQTASRTSIYLAKFPAILCYTVLFMLVYGVCQWVTMKIVYGKEIVFGVEQLGEYAPLIGIQILLFFAFLCGIAMITSVSRSNVIGITTGILCAMGVGGNLALLFKRVLDIDDVEMYFVVRNINQLSTEADSAAIQLAIGVGIVYMLGYLLIGNLCFVKRDVV